MYDVRRFNFRSIVYSAFFFLLTQLYLPAVPWRLGYFRWVCQAKRSHTTITNKEHQLMIESCHTRSMTYTVFLFFFFFLPSVIVDVACRPNICRENVAWCAPWTSFVVVNIGLTATSCVAHNFRLSFTGHYIFFDHCVGRRLHCSRNAMCWKEAHLLLRPKTV